MNNPTRIRSQMRLKLLEAKNSGDPGVHRNRLLITSCAQYGWGGVYIRGMTIETATEARVVVQIQTEKEKERTKKKRTPPTQHNIRHTQTHPILGCSILWERQSAAILANSQHDVPAQENHPLITLGSQNMGGVGVYIG